MKAIVKDTWLRNRKVLPQKKVRVAACIAPVFGQAFLEAVLRALASDPRCFHSSLHSEAVDLNEAGVVHHPKAIVINAG
jgi:hypothetical protein